MADPDLPAQAYAAGVHFEQTYGGCSQCVLAALQDTFDLRDDAVFQAATALSGGGGGAGDGSCGAYSGAILFLGQLVGRPRDDFADPREVRRDTARLAAALHDRFVDHYGSVVCRDVQESVIGRAHGVTDPAGIDTLRVAGAHHAHCPEVVGSAARWTAAIAAGWQATSA